MHSLSNKQLASGFIDWPVHMERALELAQRVITATPNPRVGCVVLRQDRLIGEGWHAGAGEDHAEVMALTACEADTDGVTVIVTLEPCSHSGRTGPCSKALIDARVSRVVIASLDPNPDVAGSGVAALEAAGIEVFHLSDYEESARRINRGYFSRRENGRPFVRCKLAMSLDGKTALANGASQWITGEAARNDVQRLRGQSCALITGVNTVLQDDPSLNFRPQQLNFSAEEKKHNRLALTRQPLRVILDSELQTPGTARTIDLEGKVKIYTATEPSESNDISTLVDIHQVTRSGEGLDLVNVLESLASEFECNEVLVEAGAKLSGAFLREGLVDEFVVYLAPKLLGDDARGLTNISGIESMANVFQLQVCDIQKIGEDVRLILLPA